MGKKFEKYRVEKYCLNCHIPIHGNYCHNCGQANLDHRHNFLSILFHYVGDLFHYDNKAIKTIKQLLLSPGIVTKKYIDGARRSYIEPIKLYIFISACFFIFLHYNHYIADLILPKDEQLAKEVGQRKNESKRKLFVLENMVKTDTILKQDTLLKNRITYYRSLTKHYGDSLFKIQKDRTSTFLDPSDSLVIGGGFNFSDDQLQTVPDSRLIKEIREEHNGDYTKYNELLVEKTSSLVPKLVFFTVPIYAFFLWLSFYKRKNNYYINHFFYTIHIYSFIFTLTIIIILLTDICNWFSHSDIANYLMITSILLGVIYFLYYNYKALKVYSAPNTKWHVLRFVMVNTSMFITLLIGLILFLVYMVAY